VTGHIGMQGSPARVNDFETSFLILFVLGCAAAIRRAQHTGGILAISTTLFGLMYGAVAAQLHPEDQFFPEHRKTTANSTFSIS